MKSSTVVASLVPLAIMASCDGPKPSAQAKRAPAEEAVRPAPKAAWQSKAGDQAVVVDGWPEAFLRFHHFETDSALRVTSRVDFKVGGKAFHLDPKALSSPIVVEIGPYLGELNVDGYRDAGRVIAAYKAHKPMPEHASHQTLALHVPLELSVGDAWEPIKIDLPAITVSHHAAATAMAKAVNNPLTFSNDATKTKPDTLITVFAIEKELDPLHGPGMQLKDIDWVATSDWRPVGKPRSCGGYSRVSNVAGNITISVQPSEVEVTVYDRRTGKSVGKHVFPPAPGCPEISTGRATGIGASNATIGAWLDARVKTGTFE
jgi:hypothetical protein